MADGDINDYLVLISGKSAAGKSASLRKLRDPENVMYLNCESGKKLPFPNKFRTYKITDPFQVIEAFDAVAQHKEMSPPGPLAKVHTIVIDSLTFLLDMYESVHVIGSANTMAAWGNFQQYFKLLMQDKVASCGLNVLFLAHTLDSYNESEMVTETKVPVKGALKNNGIEAYFSCVVSAKKVTIKSLEGYKSKLLNITAEEEALGFKYVFQTKLTKNTVNERIRSPMGLFKTEETYMDNDVQVLLDHLHNYYKE